MSARDASKAEPSAKGHARADLYSMPELRARDWTTTMVAKLLGAHDDTRDNPRFRFAGAPMKLYLRERVHAAECSPVFVALRDAAEARRTAGYEGVGTRVVNMVRRVEAAELTIVRGVSDEEIRKLAMRTHGGNYRGDPGEFRWSPRTARNCIRHNLTNYEKLWKLVNRGETGQPGYEVLRERVEALIDEAYPQFADEDEDEDEDVEHLASSRSMVAEQARTEAANGGAA